MWMTAGVVREAASNWKPRTPSGPGDPRSSEGPHMRRAKRGGTERARGPSPRSGTRPARERTEPAPWRTPCSRDSRQSAATETSSSWIHESPFAHRPANRYRLVFAPELTVTLTCV
jgi:hypothetical protein